MYDKDDAWVFIIFTVLIILNISVLVGAFLIPILRVKILTIIATAISLIFYIGGLNSAMKK